MDFSQQEEQTPVNKRTDSGVGSDIYFNAINFDQTPNERPAAHRKKSVADVILDKLPLRRNKSPEREQSISPPLTGSGRKLSVDDAQSPDSPHEEHRPGLVDRLLRRKSGQATHQAHICGVEHCICESANAAGLSDQQPKRRSSENILPAFVRRNKPTTLLSMDAESNDGLTRVQRHGDW